MIGLGWWDAFINGLRGEQLFIGSLDYTTNREVDAWKYSILDIAYLYCLHTLVCESTEIATYDDGSGIVRGQILVPVIYACRCSS